MALWWLYGGYVFPVVLRPTNTTFKVKFDLKGQSQFPPKTIGILTMLFCTSCLNLVILASMGNELWCGLAQNGVNSDFLRTVWSWRSRLIALKNIRDLYQGLLYLWSKFGDPSLKGSWVIVRKSMWIPHTRTDWHTNRRRQRQYPKAKTGLG